MVWCASRRRRRRRQTLLLMMSHLDRVNYVCLNMVNYGSPHM